MPRSIRETSIAIGFVQVPVSVYKATRDERLDLRSLCESCGSPPHQRIVCETGDCATPLPEPEDARRAVEAGRTLIVGPDGAPAAARDFPSWYHVQGRGYEWTKGQYVRVTQDEIKAAKEAAPTYDAITVTKTVDFKRLSMEHVLGAPYYLLPPEDANEVTRKAYALVTQALDQGGMALLGFLTMRDKTHRIAVVADAGKNVLMAYDVQDAREVPYASPSVATNAAEKAQVEGILKSAWSDDARLEAPPDPVLALIEAKIVETQQLPGTGQPVPLPR